MFGQPPHVEQDEYAGPPQWLLQVQIDVFGGSGGWGGGGAMLGPAGRCPLSRLWYFFSYEDHPQRVFFTLGWHGDNPAPYCRREQQQREL